MSAPLKPDVKPDQGPDERPSDRPPSGHPPDHGFESRTPDLDRSAQAEGPFVRYPADALDEALAHLQACYPEEGCGVMLAAGERMWFRPIPNVVDRYHQADPAAFPQDARSAYLFDPQVQREIWSEAANSSLRIVAIVHSHVDTDADFSELDEAMAMAGGVPLHGDLEYLIFALERGALLEAKRHRWQEGKWVSLDLPRWS